MNKFLSSLVLSIILCTTAQAAFIDYNGQVKASDLTTNSWVSGTNMWGSIDSSSGTGSNSEGLNSLNGLDISQFSFNFGDLELTNHLSPGQNTLGWEYYSEGDTSVEKVRFYYAGVEWASGSLNFLQTDVDNSMDTTATGFGTLNLNSATIDGLVFFNEIMLLTDGSGLMSFDINNFDPLGSFGLFSSTGRFSINSVPTPPSIALLAVGLIALFSRNIKRHKDTNRLTHRGYT